MDPWSAQSAREFPSGCRVGSTKMRISRLIVFDYFRVSVVTNRWVMTRRNAALSALSFEFFLSSQTPKLKYIVGGTINFFIFFLSFSCLFDFPVDGFCWFITPLSFMFSTTCLCTSHSPPFVFVRTRLVFAPITRLLLSLRASFCLCTNRRS